MSLPDVLLTPDGAPTVAVIGGGQLARMMAESASTLGIHLRALVESADGSTGQVLPDSPVGQADDAASVRAAAAGAAALTFEHEHQNDALLRQLQAEGVSVQPRPQALMLARDKLAMRRAMREAGLPQPAWTEVGGLGVSEDQVREQVRAFGSQHGWPVVLKTPRGGYDGHGVLLVRDADELTEGEAATWIRALVTGGSAGGGGSLGGAAVTSLLVEEAVPFTRELAVLVARSPRGDLAVWPVVESVQDGGICSEVLAPAPQLDPAAAEEAERIGRQVAERFDVTGVLAVELFAVEPGPASDGEDVDGVDSDGTEGDGVTAATGESDDSDRGEGRRRTRILINELAMRPHNSGHWTQDGAVTSQFAQHLRAVANLPLGSTEPTGRATVMVNYLGGSREPGPGAYAAALVADPAARIHLYGKDWRPGRKLGHVNVTLPGDPALAPSRAEMEALRERARAVVAALRGER